MRHGSLFSGIGGFDLAAQWMGWENVFHCEWNKFGQKILKHYWPNAISYHDITKSTFTIHRGSIDVLTGGFPCQPFSAAGKRKGTEDDRYLWPEMLRVIREVQPRYIVGENVRGLVNWNGGLVFNRVCADLEFEGYEVLPVLLPAASVNAPHRRDRVWFIAYSNNSRGSDGLGQVQRANGEVYKWDNDAEFGNANQCDVTDSESFGGSISQLDQQIKRKSVQAGSDIDRFTDLANAPDTNGIGLRGKSDWQGKSKFNGQNNSPNDWRDFPTVSPICSRNDGLSDRLDGITFPKWRNESIKGAGNAIVPQVAFQIFKTIEQYDLGTEETEQQNNEK